MSNAQAIVNVLGNNKFIAMTGAKNFVNTKTGVRFDLPRGFAKNKANKVNDEFVVEFVKFAKLDCVTISEHTVQVDNLREVFTRETGLYVSL